MDKSAVSDRFQSSLLVSVLVLLALFVNGCRLDDNSLKGNLGSEAPVFKPTFKLNNNNPYTPFSFVSIEIDAAGATEYSLHTSQSDCENSSSWQSIASLLTVPLTTLNTSNQFF